MKNISEQIRFIVSLAKTYSVLLKRFEGGLGNGLGFNEFLILFHLNQSPGGKLRRIDLAEKIGITASGVTRLLLPMEKIGLIKSDSNNTDARVKFVIISKSGQEKINETQERLSDLTEEIFSPLAKKELNNLSKSLIDIGGKILMN